MKMKPLIFRNKVASVVFFNNEPVYAAGGKNSAKKAEAFMLLATEGRTVHAKARACAAGLSFSDGLRAGEVFRNRGSK